MSLFCFGNILNENQHNLSGVWEGEMTVNWFALL